MQRKEQGGMRWLQFDLLCDVPHFFHAVFLRAGGVSEGAFASLNLGYGIGDTPENVQHNLRLVEEVVNSHCAAKALLFWSKQCHGIDLTHVGPQSPQETASSDALVTAHPYVSLMIKHADCQAAIILDPRNRVVANVHAGWRGSVQNIYAHVIHSMQKTYGSNPADLLVGIGPSLGPEAAEFVNFQTELPIHFWDYQIKPHYFDFWAISEMQLKELGVQPHHIEVMRLCTHSHKGDFFSYRRDKITGRHATLAVLA